MKGFIIQILLSIWHYLRADWLILLIGISLSVIMSTYLESEKLKNMLMKRNNISIPAAVLLGALTPLCACGTMAVLLSMFVTAMPWGAVMAFLISSPLTSPSEYLFETAFFGSKFATAVLISSIILGLVAGILANILEKRTNFFNGQFRLISAESESCCDESKKDLQSRNCCSKNARDINNKRVNTLKRNSIIKNNENPKIENHTEDRQLCCPSQGSFSRNNSFVQKYKLDKLAKEFINIGLKKVLFYFIIFITIGRAVEMIIPQSLIMTLFSANKYYSIPLAATIGLPLYLNDSSALPLLKSFVNSGASQGAALAFIITGKATGAPVIAGMATFLKKKALLYYAGFVYTGGILAGYIYQIIFY